MKQRLSKHKGKKVRQISWLAMVVLGFLLFAGSAAADEGARIQAEDGKWVDADPVAKVTIDKKFAQRVVSTGGESFAVSKATLIIGEDGKQVRYKAMRVPCEAQITYKKGRARKATTIKIISTGINTTTEVIYEKPE